MGGSTVRSSITGKEIAEFIDKYSAEELADMPQGMMQSISKACETMNAIVTVHPELFILNRVHVKLEVEDRTGKPVRIELGSQMLA